MTWLRLSESFGDECAHLSDAAFRTHAEALGWVMNREKGGELRTRDVQRFAGSDDWRQAVEELVRVGFWEALDNGYRVVHHMEHQPTPEALAARRAKAVKRQQHRVAKLAAAIYARDGYACRYCGTADGPFHLDHVIPVSAGGLSTLENLVTACVPCNLRKGAQVWTPNPTPGVSGDADSQTDSQEVEASTDDNGWPEVSRPVSGQRSKDGRGCVVCSAPGSLLAGKDGKLRCRRHHFDQAAA